MVEVLILFGLSLLLEALNIGDPITDSPANADGWQLAPLLQALDGFNRIGPTLRNIAARDHVFAVRFHLS